MGSGRINGIREQLINRHGKAWGFNFILALGPVDRQLAMKMQEIVEQQPSYNPFPTIIRHLLSSNMPSIYGVALIPATTWQFGTSAEELLSWSFHEMMRQAKVIHFEKRQELYGFKEKPHKLKEHLNL